MSPNSGVRNWRAGGLPSDRFAPHPFTLRPKLSFNGGPLLTNVEVFTVFWGKAWRTDPELAALAQGINGFFRYIVTSPLLDHLGEYSVPGQTIGHGSWVGTRQLDRESGVLLDDGDVQAALLDWIAHDPAFPRQTGNALTFLYFAPGISISHRGDLSCQGFGGYHNAVDSRVFYAVEPYCPAPRPTLSQLDFVTLTSSHELCEAITDPVPGRGWYWFRDDRHQGEIGDICESAPDAEQRMGDYLVQREWSNHLNRCV